MRERHEYTHNPVWGDDPQDDHGVFLQRYVLFGDLHLGPRVRVFGELYSALESGREGPSNPIDENHRRPTGVPRPVGPGADRGHVRDGAWVVRR